MANREEWLEQVTLSHLLDAWLDPTCSFWTATDPVAGSLTSGLMRKKRGVKAGVPDVIVWYCGRSVAIELKSRYGRCSRPQRTVREALLNAGVEWWECRSANAAMWALAQSGVPFRALVGNAGTTKYWRQPKLAPWELPRRDPAEPRPTAPELTERRRVAQRRWPQRQRDAATAADVAA